MGRAMKQLNDLKLRQLEAKAGEAGRVLRLLANERRLLILCQLAGGECAAGALGEKAGLSQSALSQHLAKMREEKLVATRREAQTVYYRIADRRVAQLLTTLKDVFCR